jgi:hypothetical protein
MTRFFDIRLVLTVKSNATHYTPKGCFRETRREICEVVRLAAGVWGDNSISRAQRDGMNAWPNDRQTRSP